MIYYKYNITLDDNADLIKYFNDKSINELNDEFHEVSTSLCNAKTRRINVFEVLKCVDYYFIEVNHLEVLCVVGSKDITFKPRDFIHLLKKLLKNLSVSTCIKYTYEEILCIDYINYLKKVDNHEKYMTTGSCKVDYLFNEPFNERLNFSEKIDDGTYFNSKNCNLWNKVTREFGNNEVLNVINFRNSKRFKIHIDDFTREFSNNANLFLFTSSEESEEIFLKWYLASLFKCGVIKSKRISNVTLHDNNVVYSTVKRLAEYASMSTLIVNLKKLDDREIADLFFGMYNHPEDIIKHNSRIIFLFNGYRQPFYKFVKYGLPNCRNTEISGTQHVAVPDLLSIQAAEDLSWRCKNLVERGLKDHDGQSDTDIFDKLSSIFDDEDIKAHDTEVSTDMVDNNGQKLNMSDDTDADDQKLKNIYKKYDKELEGFCIEACVHDAYSDCEMKPEQKMASKEFYSLPGMTNLKSFVRNLVASNKLNKNEGINQNSTLDLNILVTGNSGTGKTIALTTLIRVLYEENILHSSKYVYVSPADLNSKYWDGSGKKIDALLEYLENGTFFLDDAHALYINNHNSFSAKEVLSKIKSSISKNPKINFFVSGKKEGIDRAFEMQGNIKGEFTNTFHIDNYNPDELIQIQDNLALKMGISLSSDAKKFSKNIYDAYYLNDDFCNGKFVEILLKQAHQNASNRVLSELGDVDINSLSKRKQEEIQQKKDYLEEVDLRVELVNDFLINDRGLTAEDALKQIIGLNDVKDKLNDYVCLMAIDKEREKITGKNSNVTMHMSFTGSPGTGKTTMARLAARLLKEKGILRTGKFTECSRSSFIKNAYVSIDETVEKIIKNSLGGVLFIDEVYSICLGSYDTPGQVIINELVSKIENNREDLMVIFAGYENETNQFLEQNAGLKSRIAFHLNFPNYSIDELLEILKNQAEKLDLKITPGFCKEAKIAFENCVSLNNFSNGRFARNIIEKAKIKQAGRVYKMMNNSAFDNKELFMLKKIDFDDSVYDEFGGKDKVINHKAKPIGFADTNE